MPPCIDPQHPRQPLERQLAIAPKSWYNQDSIGSAPMKILVLNAGSSSQKSSLYNLSDSLPSQPPSPLWTAQIDWGRHPQQVDLKVETAAGTQRHTLTSSPQAATQTMLETLWQGDRAVLSHPTEIDGVGHRVVHGGQDYTASVRITPAVEAAIARLIPLAPSHNPANLAGIQAMTAILGEAVPQVAVFDTAFHSQMPAAAATYPIPYSLTQAGLRRYGFHGISHGYCARRAAHLLGQPLDSLRLITCHLGNGASLAAIAQGRSIDTTMGFTPLEGLMMGSRSGSVDPGLLLHLLRDHYTVDQLDHLLNRESGFLGVSGRSSDLRDVFAAIAEGDAQAQLAFDVYIHRLRGQVGSMLMTLGGLDGLIFTAGIGERSPEVRAAVCDALGFLGVHLDRDRNAQNPADALISSPTSTVPVLVIQTQEDWAIAQECWHLLTQA
jgi:acetate kinase